MVVLLEHAIRHDSFSKSLVSNDRHSMKNINQSFLPSPSPSKIHIPVALRIIVGASPATDETGKYPLVWSTWNETGVEGVYTLDPDLVFVPVIVLVTNRGILKPTHVGSLFYVFQDP